MRLTTKMLTTRGPRAPKGTIVTRHMEAETPKSLLVGGWATPLKNMSSSIGMMKFLIYGKIKNGNQTTDQLDDVAMNAIFCLVKSDSDATA